MLIYSYIKNEFEPTRVTYKIIQRIMYKLKINEFEKRKNWGSFILSAKLDKSNVKLFILLFATKI